MKNNNRGASPVLGAPYDPANVVEGDPYKQCFKICSSESVPCTCKPVVTRETLEAEFQRYVTIAKDGGYVNPYEVLEKLEALIGQIDGLYAEQKMALEDRAHEIGELFWGR